jgi:hypothetical protein
MATLKHKTAEAKARLKEMEHETPVSAAARRREDPTSPAERKLRRAMGRFDRLQSQVDRLEARVRSYEVGGVAPPAWEDPERPADPAIEAELDALRERIRGVGAATEPDEAPAPATDDPSAEAPAEQADEHR